MIKLFVILIFILIISFLFVFSTNNDFVDQTVIIEHVDYDEGTIHLLGSNGQKHTGILQGVNWQSDGQVLSEIKQLINNARKNSIIFSKKGNELVIWFQTASGSENLNKAVIKIIEKYDNKKNNESIHNNIPSSKGEQARAESS